MTREDVADLLEEDIAATAQAVERWRLAILQPHPAQLTVWYVRQQACLEHHLAALCARRAEVGA